ncbi:hypothetical protein F2Q69_00047678 [Brassica cretica]|uniref:Uncharacterized protein n=1 Tax=Brassica cretica TaxID=69181 RepID=A0A8S9PIT5_BRACR|nr:hypothetical protein F2Q69_00047678 [Brassica cretica]
MVPAKSHFRTYAGRSSTLHGQYVRYSEKHEPRLKCSERPELHAELNVELVGEDELWYGQFGRLVVVSSRSSNQDARGTARRSVGIFLLFELLDSMKCLMQNLLQSDINLKLILIKHIKVASLGFGEGTITTSDPPLIIIEPVLSLPFDWSNMALQIMSRFIRTRWMHGVKIRTLAGMSGWKDELWYGQFGRLVVVPAEAPIGTHVGRLGQSDWYGRMNEPQSNCSEHPDLHAGQLQWTDPRTGAHHKRDRKTPIFEGTLIV